MRVLVCGGRDFNDAMTLGSWLGGIHKQRGITLLVHGGARGADYMAGKFAEWAGIPCDAYAIDHALDGPWPGAGPRRNERMLAASKPDLVVAFAGGRGTADMVRQAKAAGVRVIEAYKVNAA